jgi:hypothetical protein
VKTTYNRAITHGGICSDCNQWVCEGNCPHGLINIARKKEITRWEKQLGEELMQPSGSTCRRKRKKKKQTLKLVTTPANEGAEDGKGR